MSDHEVEVQVEVKNETPKALLVDFGGKAEEWVPKSQITDECRDKNGRLTSIFIPHWLALKKGMI